MTILGNSPRESISAARNGGSGTSVSLQTSIIVYALVQYGGFSLEPEHLQATLAAAAAVAGAWAFVAGAIGKVSRDELHRADAGVYMGPGKRLLLTLGSALG